MSLFLLIIIYIVFLDVIEALFLLIYPGVPTFFGAPKMHFSQPLVDRVNTKLASWKGKCLSIIGHVQLVKCVISSIMSYNFQISKWPINLLNETSKWVTNFIWNSFFLKMALLLWVGTLCS